MTYRMIHSHRTRWRVELLYGWDRHQKEIIATNLSAKNARKLLVKLKTAQAVADRMIYGKDYMDVPF